jgi:glucose/arabinose dehydrogenase
MKLTMALFVCTTVSAAVAGAQTALDELPEVIRNVSDGQAFKVVQLVSDLDHPWAMAFLPGGGMLITERAGRLLRYTGPGGEPSELREITGLPRISSTGQGGLLDVVLHPDYESNGWIYFTYSSRYGFGHGTTLARSRISGDALDDVEVLFRMGNPDGGGRHFGSRLVFGTDGKLYMTIGERGSRNRAQDLQDHAGTVLRFNADGSVPADNPFVERRDARPEIYSYGHRNAQGIAVNPATGQIWLHEHGPRGGDEINIVEAGLNYGWPVVSYGAEYASGRPVGEGTHKPGMEQPLLYWTPSIAPSGAAFYDGDRFPAWRGDFFVGALAGQHLRRVDLDGNEVAGEEALLQGVVGRVRDVRTGPDGLIYILTDEDAGGLYRLEPLN